MNGLNGLSLGARDGIRSKACQAQQQAPGDSPGLVESCELVKPSDSHRSAISSRTLLTGARWGEVSGLEVTDVDLEAGHVLGRLVVTRAPLKSLTVILLDASLRAPGRASG